MYHNGQLAQKTFSAEKLNNKFLTLLSKKVRKSHWLMGVSPLALAACGGSEENDLGTSNLGGSSPVALGITKLFETASFQETRQHEGFWYQDEYTEPSLVYNSPSRVMPVDIGADGDLDLIVPITVGYRSGIDTRSNFKVYENVDGSLVYSQELTDAAPFVAGSGRAEVIYLQNQDTEALVTVNIDTTPEGEQDSGVPWGFGDLAIVALDPFASITEAALVGTSLPNADEAGRPTAVNAHALAIGDLNRDGLDDILIGDLTEGAHGLLQKQDGKFEYFTTELLLSLSNWQDPALPANNDSPYLLDLHMDDFNGDGFDDIVVGWGHETSASRVFFNSDSGFSVDTSTVLPESVYGINDSLHMSTFSEDFDSDGDQDLIIVYSRDEPYYGGVHLQYLTNDGNGNFLDETSSRLIDPNDYPNTYGERLDWHNNFQVLDIDSDGDYDIVGNYSSTDHTKQEPIIFRNDGQGYFELIELPLISNVPFYLVAADFNQNDELELVSYSGGWDDPEGTSATYYFEVYEVSGLPEALSVTADV